MRVTLAAVLFFLPFSVYSQCKVDESQALVLNDSAACLRNSVYRAAVESAALSGRIDAASLLADYYMDGAGDDRGKAIHWLRVYVKGGGEAPLILGQMLLKSKSYGDVGEGEEILLRKAKAGESVAAELLADHLVLSGQSLDSRLWYEQAALAGRSSAMIKLGDIFVANDQNASKYLGLMWILAASNHFADGSFMRNQLLEKAIKVASQSHLDIEKGKVFAYALEFPSIREEKVPGTISPHP